VEVTVVKALPATSSIQSWAVEVVEVAELTGGEILGHLDAFQHDT
jgi:hypothetical protein